MSSSTSWVPQPRAHVLSVLLSSVLAAEKEPTRLWLQAEMDRTVQPMLNSIFLRLTNKLANVGWNQERAGGDGVLVVNSMEHFETDNQQIHEPSSHIGQPSTSTSTYYPDSFPQHSIGYEPENDPEILAQVKREIKEEENELALKNVMDNGQNSQFVQQIEDCNEENISRKVDNVTLQIDRLEPEIRKKCYQTTNQSIFSSFENENVEVDEEDDGEEDGDNDNKEINNVNDERVEENQDEGSSVYNEPMDTTPSKNGQSSVMGQLSRVTKRKQIEGEQLTNQLNNQEGITDEDDDVEEVITSRSVKRARSGPTSSSSTKPNTQIITHTLQCPGCNEMIDKAKFNSHMKEEHSIGLFQCAVKNCHQSFDSTQNLSHHLAQSHQSTSEWHCDACDQHYLSYNQLSKHNTQLHQLGHFQCSFPACTFTGEYKNEVINHYKRQHKPTVKCAHPGCTYESQHASSLKRHELVHAGIKPYKCKWIGCVYASAQRTHTIRHIRRMHFSRSPSSSVRINDYLEVNEMLLGNLDGLDANEDVNSSTEQNTQFINHTSYPQNLNFQHHKLNQTPSPNLYFTKSNEQSNHNLANWENDEYQIIGFNNRHQANSFVPVESSSITQFHQPLSSFTSYYNSNYYKPSTFNSRQPSSFNAHQPSTSFTSFLNPQNFHQQHSIRYEMGLQNMMNNRSNPHFGQQIEDDEFDEYPEVGGVEGGGMSDQVGQIKNGENRDMEREGGDDDDKVTSLSVERPRPTTLRSTKQKQLITHTLQCPQCGLMFAQDKFNQHLKDEHSIGPFRCMVKDCKQSFTHTYLLGQHLGQSHQSISQWHCDACDHHYPSYRYLSIHNNTQLHQYGHFQCSFPSCTFTGDYRKKVINHYALQHKQKVLRKCHHFDCQFETSNASQLKQHQRTHLNVRPYRCKWPQCGFVSARRANTIGHIHRMHLMYAHNPSSLLCSIPLGDASDYVEMV